MEEGPPLFLADDVTYPVVDEAELLGRTPTAVALRAHPRDLYDMHRMLGLDRHRKPRARAMYLAYSFLKDHEWHRLDYPVRLQVPYDPERLRDVLGTAEAAPTLEVLRDQARHALGGFASTPGPGLKSSTALPAEEPRPRVCHAKEAQGWWRPVE